jgi:hypothetical protein
VGFLSLPESFSEDKKSLRQTELLEPRRLACRARSVFFHKPMMRATIKKNASLNKLRNNDLGISNPDTLQKDLTCITILRPGKQK